MAILERILAGAGAFMVIALLAWIGRVVTKALRRVEKQSLDTQRAMNQHRQTLNLSITEIRRAVDRLEDMDRRTR